MEKPRKSYPSLPSNYVTIVDLQNRWLQQKQQQHHHQQQQQLQENNQQINKGKEQTTHNLTNKRTNRCDDVKLRHHLQFHKPNLSKFRQNPNFKPRNADFQGKKLVKEFQASSSSSQSSQFNVATAKEEANEMFSSNEDIVGDNVKFNSQCVKEFRVAEKANNPSPKSSQFNVATPKVESNHIISNNEDESEKNSQCRSRRGKIFGIKPVKESRVVKKASNSTPESSQINFATSTKIESNHILSNNEDEEDKRKSSQFKPVKEFRKASIASNSTPESLEIDVAVAKVQSKHIISNNADEFAKNSQFRIRSGIFYGKKHVKEFRVVEKASDSTPESSQIDVATAKEEPNHITNNKEDEYDKNVKKNSRFRKNPNFKNGKKNFRNSSREKRLKELESNAAVKTVKNDDRKVEDDDDEKTKKKRNKKKYGKTIVNDRTVGKKGKDDEGEDQTAETEHKLKEVSVVEKNEGSTAVIQEGEDHTADIEHKLKEVNVGEKNERSTAVIQEGEDQTAEIEHKLKEVTVAYKDERSMALIEVGQDQTVEVDGMMKEVNESNKNGSVIEEGRRVYGGYPRVNHRNYNYRSTRNHDYNRSTVAIARQIDVHWGYNGAHHRGSFNRRNMCDKKWGRSRSTALIEGWRGEHRGYSGGELKWVKIEKE